MAGNTYCGVWVSEETYQVGSIVTYLGSTYTATSINTNTVPTNTTYWTPYSSSSTGIAGIWNWRGTWQIGAFYNPLDAVQYNGSSYVGLQSSLGQEPDATPGSWDVVALGVNAKQGVPGVNGQGFAWRNTWSSEVTYNAYDCVEYEGSAYVCASNSVLDVPPPSNTTEWNVLAAGGSGGSGGTSITLETNGAANGSQDILNLVAGANVTLSDDGDGNITIASSGSGTAQVNSDWTAVSGVAEILHKPTLGTAAAQNTTAFDTAGSAATVQTNLTAEVSRAETAEAACEKTANKGVANGYAALDSSTKVPLAQIPTIPYSDLSGTPTLATVATSGSYADLSDKPTIPTVPITSIEISGSALTPSAGAINLVAGANVTLTPSGNEVTISATSGGGGGNVTLEVNGTPSSSQAVLNIENGTNTTVTDVGGGTVQVSVSGLGSAAFQPTSAFDASGSAAGVQSNLTTEVSRAETAEALLAPKASPTFTGTVSGITATMVGALPSSTVLPATEASVSHKWINSYNATTGAFTQTQPATTDLSDIGTFTLPYSQLSGTPTLGTAAAQDTSTFDTAGAAASVQANLTTEITRAEAAEALLLPVTTAASTYATLTSLSSEATARSGADTTNANAIAAETTRAENAEVLLLPIATASSTYATQTSLSTETGRAEAAEALLVPKTTTVNGHALSGNITVAYSDLTGLPTLGSAAAQNSTAFDSAGTSAAETTRAETAEALLLPITTAASTYATQVSLASEVTRAETAEGLLAPKSSPTFTGTVSGITAAMVSALPSSTQLPVTEAAVAHKWINSYTSSTGAFTQTQPATTDLSDIGSFVLPYSQLSGTPTLATTFASVAHECLNSYNSSTGVFTAIQLATTDLKDIGTFTLPYSQLTGTPTIPVVATAVPIIDGTATIGSTGKWADSGHIHPTDTSRQASLGYTPTNAAVVPSTAPSSGQVLVGNSGGTAYAPITLSGPVSVTSTGVTSVATLNQSTTGSSGSCTGNAATATNVAWSGLTGSPSTTQVPFQSLTTTGTGAATLSVGVLNVPTPSIPVVATTVPMIDGTATIGSTGKWADAGHIHPTDTSRQAALTLTTTGTSGAATLTGATLNIPQYSGGSTINFSENETPSGTINGSNATFTLAHAPVTNSLKLYWNGLRTTDFTLSGVTITMNSGSIPQVSTPVDTLLADYRY